MRTNILLSLASLLSGLLIGFTLFYKEQVEQPKLEISKSQEQVQKCKATITKRENLDGSKDEITEFLVENYQKQNQSIKETKKENKKNSLGLFKDELIYKRKIYEDINIFGFEFDLGIVTKTNTNKIEFGFNIDF